MISGFPRVLLVEDTGSLSQISATTPSRDGQQVDATSGAMTALRPGRHRVVLLDLPLPDGNGQNEMRAIAARGPEARVLVITADGSISQAVEVQPGGGVARLAEPVDALRLVGVVNAAMANCAPPDRPAAPSGRGSHPSPGPVYLPAPAAAAPVVTGFAEQEDDPSPLVPPAEAGIPAGRISRSKAIAKLVGEPLAAIERAVIEATIEHCGGSVPRAARVLGLSASTVYRKLATWGSAPSRR